MSRIGRLSSFGILAIIVAALAILVPADEVCADSWAMPATETVYAPLGEYRFTVEPAPIGSQLEYFAEEVRALESEVKVERPAPLGLLEVKNSSGNWEPIWAVSLVNSVAPVAVLVAEDGDHVVTFDNWHSVGRGENVIVIYGPKGKLIRSMPLTELLPQEYIDALPHTVSSLSWRKSSQIDEKQDKLKIEVIVPGSRDNPDTIIFTLSLSDGSVTEPEASEWANAQCSAKAKMEELRKAEEARIAFFTDPLLPPETCNMPDWHSYVREAYYRLSPEGIDGSTATKILFPPDHERHQISIGWLVDAVAEELDFPGNIAAAAPCGDEALVPAFAKAFAEIPPDSLTETSLYVSTSRSNFEKIAQLASESGAKLIWLDPSQAIPQRPERIPGSLEQEAADAKRLEEMLEEVSDLIG